MSTDLDALMTPRPDGEALSWDVPEGWRQGRGAFGGLVLGALVRALESRAPEGLSLRSLTATLAGPAMVGPSRITLADLRRGSGTAMVEARLSQGDELRTHAVGVFGRRRVDDGDWGEPAEVGDWTAATEIPIGPPLAPEFTQHMRMWPVEGLPFSSDPRRTTSGWVLAKQPGARRDNAFLAAHVDAWWPAGMVGADRPRPVATISFHLDLLGDTEGLAPDAPLHHHATCRESRDGWMHEDRVLRGHDGRILARNSQAIVLIR